MVARKFWRGCELHIDALRSRRSGWERNRGPPLVAKSQAAPVWFSQEARSDSAGIKSSRLLDTPEPHINTHTAYNQQE